MTNVVRLNKTKLKIQSGEIAIGAMHAYNSPESVEVLAALGFDFVTFDLEHEAYDELALVESIRAAEAFDLTPIVRLPNDPDLILRLLDAGAQGIHVPRINTKSDARSVVAACRFHPQGERTFYALGRSGNYGIGLSEEEYAQSSNRETLIILQIEEEEGISNLHEIISVPYIDSIQFGPKDLWQSMGMPDRSLVWEVIYKSLAEVSKAGLYGSMVSWLNSELGSQLMEYDKKGVRMITVSSRELFIYGGQHYLSLTRSALNR